MIFITLTRSFFDNDNSPVLINLSNVTHFYPKHEEGGAANGTVIQMVDDSIFFLVNESFEEIESIIKTPTT